MELGRCEEGLPEESRWAGKGCARTDALKPGEAWEGSQSTGKQTGGLLLWATCLGRNSERRDGRLDRADEGTGVVREKEGG